MDMEYPRGEKAYGWKGGRIINFQGYVMIYKPNHPHALTETYALEHRLVMEKHLGRYLKHNEEVHHKNGNRQDNRLKNLCLHTKSSHMKLHNGDGKWGMHSPKRKKKKLECKKCFKIFISSHPRKKFCSKQCLLKYNNNDRRKFKKLSLGLL